MLLLIEREVHTKHLLTDCMINAENSDRSSDIRTEKGEDYMKS